MAIFTDSIDPMQTAPMKLNENTKSVATEERSQLADQLTIAGAKEALDEKIVWIRGCFAAVLLLLMCCTIRDTYGLAREWMRGSTVDELRVVTDKESLPMANVTVCAEVFINETYVRNNLSIPADLAEQLKNETGMNTSEILHQLAYHLARTTNSFRKFSTIWRKSLRLVSKANPQLYDYANFLRAALPQCHEMLTNCKFNGEQFDCCQRIHQLVDDGGVCYQFGIGYDASSRRTSQLTLSQSVLGPAGGLTFDADIDTSHLSLDEENSDGFKIYVQPSAITPLLSPLTAPSGTETFVKVAASERAIRKSCIQPNKLPPMRENSYYDSRGYNCITDKVMERMLTYFGDCEYPYVHNRPNVSRVCSPDAISLGEELLQGKGQDMAYSRPHDAVSIEILKKEKEAKRFTSKVHCPTFCQYWDYNSVASFSYLVPENASSTSTRMFSRVHIYYSDFFYLAYEEVPTMNMQIFFSQFGDVIGLYLGMSFISVPQTLFHLGNYWLRVYARDRVTKVS